MITYQLNVLNIMERLQILILLQVFQEHFLVRILILSIHTFQLHGVVIGVI